MRPTIVTGNIYHGNVTVFQLPLANEPLQPQHEVLAMSFDEELVPIGLLDPFHEQISKVGLEPRVDVHLRMLYRWPTRCLRDR